MKNELVLTSAFILHTGSVLVRTDLFAKQTVDAPTPATDPVPAAATASTYTKTDVAAALLANAAAAHTSMLYPLLGVIQQPCSRPVDAVQTPALDAPRKSSAPKELKYACECGRSYETKSAMNYHRKWICASAESFRCAHCPYKAKRYYCFKQHLQRKHKMSATVLAGKRGYMFNNEVAS